MMSIILYTTHCPKCEVLTQKLKNKNINFEIIDDIELIKEKNITMVPVLSVNDQLMNFKEAVDWINNYN